MKQNAITLVLILLTLSLHAQWIGSTNSTDAIFRTGNVGIGTTVAPTVKFEVNNGNATAPAYFRVDPNSSNFQFFNTTTGSGNSIVDIANKRAVGSTVDGGAAMLSLDYDASNLISAPAVNKSSIFIRTDDVYNGFLQFLSSNADFTTLVSTQMFEVNGNTGKKFARMSIATGHADHFRWEFDNVEKMRITSAGNVGIGTSTPGSFKLAVEGKIGAREMQILNTNPFPDYVFEADYKLMSLEELQLFIAQHGRLPEMPSAQEVKTNGIAVGEMNVTLVKKVEELTLYLLELNKQVEAQSKLIEEQRKMIAELNHKVN